MKIEVVEELPAPKDRPGQLVCLALIGPDRDPYEIRVLGKQTHYYVRRVRVSAAVFRDCRETANLDRWCPDCDASNEDFDGTIEPEPVVS